MLAATTNCDVDSCPGDSICSVFEVVQNQTLPTGMNSKVHARPQALRTGRKDGRRLVDLRSMANRRIYAQFWRKP